MLKKKKAVILIAVAAVVVLIGGIAIYRQTGNGSSSDGSENTTADGEAGDSGTDVKMEYTDEEKARIESQTGVTVTDEGTVQVDIGAIQAEEESMEVSREEAGELVLKELGEGSELISMDLRQEQENYYWAARASKEDETYQVWISADTGDTFINQKE